MSYTIQTLKYPEGVREKFWRFEFTSSKRKYYKLVARVQDVGEDDVRRVHKYEEMKFNLSRGNEIDSYRPAGRNLEISYESFLYDYFPKQLSEISFGVGVHYLINEMHKNNGKVPGILPLIYPTLIYHFCRDYGNNYLNIFEYEFRNVRDPFRRSLLINSLSRDNKVSDLEKFLSLEKQVETFIPYIQRGFRYRFCSKCEPVIAIGERTINQYLSICNYRKGMLLCIKCDDKLDDLLSSANHPNQVVFFAESDGKIYIGSSSTVRSRLQELKYEHRREFKLIAVIPSDNPDQVEKEVHESLEKHRVKGRKWYKNNEYIQNYIMENCVTEFLGYWSNL